MTRLLISSLTLKDSYSLDGRKVEEFTQAGAAFASYSYDARGNVLSRSETAPAGVWSFTYVLSS